MKKEDRQEIWDWYYADLEANVDLTTIQERAVNKALTRAYKKGLQDMKTITIK